MADEMKTEKAEEIKDTPKKKKGEITLEKQIPLGIVMDERLADGHLYAQAFASIEKYLKNPALLETPPENVRVDYEFEGLSERFKSEKTKKKEAKKAEKIARKAAKAQESSDGSTPAEKEEVAV